MFYHPELHNKLGKLWDGPFLVVEKLGEVNYSVQKHRTARKITLHVDHIKSYEHDDTPECWMDKSNDKETQTNIT